MKSSQSHATHRAPRSTKGERSTKGGRSTKGERSKDRLPRLLKAPSPEQVAQADQQIAKLYSDLQEIFDQRSTHEKTQKALTSEHKGILARIKCVESEPEKTRDQELLAEARETLKSVNKRQMELTSQKPEELPREEERAIRCRYNQLVGEIRESAKSKKSGGVSKQLHERVSQTVQATKEENPGDESLRTLVIRQSHVIKYLHRQVQELEKQVNRAQHLDEQISKTQRTVRHGLQHKLPARDRPDWKKQLDDWAEEEDDSEVWETWDSREGSTHDEPDDSY